MRHLEEHGISYYSHFKRSMYFSYKSLQASVVFLIHSVFPDVFIYTGSGIISELDIFLK